MRGGKWLGRTPKKQRQGSIMYQVSTPDYCPAGGDEAYRPSPMLEAILAYVEAHLTSSTLSVETAAHDFRISKRYIHKLFTPTAVTFSKHVTSRRLDRIAEQLLVQPLPISLLAGRYGFKDISTFNRAFKNRYRMTPTTYRYGLREKAPRYSLLPPLSSAGFLGRPSQTRRAGQ